MVTERDILKHVKAYSKRLGLYALRLSLRQGVEVGWPDTLVFGPGRVLGIETKRPGQKPTSMQQERGKTMVQYGQAWAKCDSKDDVEFTLMNFARHCVGEDLLTMDEWKSMKVRNSDA